MTAAYRQYISQYISPVVISLTALIAGIAMLAILAGGATGASGRLSFHGLADGQTLSGKTTWEAIVASGPTVDHVEFFIDRQLVWTEQSAPYRYKSDPNMFDTSALSNGAHTLSARLFDTQGGNETLTVTVTVANGTAAPPPPSGAPVIVTSTPVSGQTLSGAVSWEATVTGPTASRVEFFIDGALKHTELYSPYQYLSKSSGLDTTDLANGAHALKVVAYGAGGSSMSHTVNVTVANGTATPPSGAPVIVTSTPVSGQTLSGAVSWEATVTGATAFRVEFFIDGALKHTELSRPYQYLSKSFGLVTTSLADGKHALKVVAYGSNGTSTSHTVNVTVVNNATVPPPTNTTPSASDAPRWIDVPTVSGSAVVGHQLTAGTGSWVGTGLVYSYSWERCSSAGSCAAIAGATSNAYTITPSDTGTTLRVRVKATNGLGSAEAVSQTTAVVAAAPPTSSGNVGSKLPGRLPSSTGTNYYVDGARGSDSGSGTLAAPWRTINKALATVPTSGSIINVRGGTYVGMHVLNRYGSTSNPITLQPYQGEKVVLTSPTNSDNHALLVSKGGGIRIRGFEVTSPTGGNGIKVENGRDVEIVGNDFHNTGETGLVVAGSTSSAPTGSSNIQVWNNRFHDNGNRTLYDHSIYWGAISSNTDGIDHTTYGGVIANNLFYNQPSGFQLQVGSEASGLIVTNNTFYRATNANPGGSAIVLYSETQSPQYATRNVLIVNNLITYAANRGVYGSGGGGVMSTNVVRNNLAYGNAQGDFLSYYGDPSNVLFQLGENTVSRMPLFRNGKQLDFRLQPNSPAIGAADPAYAPETDSAGQKRVGAPDLGALESTATKRP